MKVLDFVNVKLKKDEIDPEDFSARMERIRQSLEEIDKLMADRNKK